jgi:hypothetical protein
MERHKRGKWGWLVITIVEEERPVKKRDKVTKDAQAMFLIKGRRFNIGV